MLQKLMKIILKKKKIIKETLLKLGVDEKDIDDIIKKADLRKNSNQILEFTKEAKNLEHEKKN